MERPLPSENRPLIPPPAGLLRAIGDQITAGDQLDVSKLFEHLDKLNPHLPYIESLPDQRKVPLMQGFHILGQREDVQKALNERFDIDEASIIAKREITLLEDLQIASLLGIENERIARLRDEYEKEPQAAHQTPVISVQPPTSAPAATEPARMGFLTGEQLDTYTRTKNQATDAFGIAIGEEPDIHNLADDLHNAQARYPAEANFAIHSDLVDYLHDIGSNLQRDQKFKAAAVCFRLVFIMYRKAEDQDPKILAKLAEDYIRANSAYRSKAADQANPWLIRNFDDLNRAKQIVESYRDSSGEDNDQLKAHFSDTIWYAGELIGFIEEAKAKQASQQESPLAAGTEVAAAGQLESESPVLETAIPTENPWEQKWRSTSAGATQPDFTAGTRLNLLGVSSGEFVVEATGEKRGDQIGVRFPDQSIGYVDPDKLQEIKPLEEEKPAAHNRFKEHPPEARELMNEIVAGMLKENPNTNELDPLLEKLARFNVDPEVASKDMAKAAEDIKTVVKGYAQEHGISEQEAINRILEQ